LAYYLRLELDVSLTGLCGDALLNGKEGVVTNLDPQNKERWKVRLDDGRRILVKSANFVHVRRGEYRRAKLE
jgi:hypothetical protein